MLRTYVQFAESHWRPLAAGALLMALSIFGQTVLISVFGGRFRQTFVLSNGEFGVVYAAATIGAALTLPVLGPRIDGVPVRRFAWTVLVALAGASLAVALSPNVLVFAGGLYAVRLAGMGLVHTAVTATAKALPSDVGKALGLIALGSTAAQATLPFLAVATVEWFGWRWTWGLVAVAVLCAGRTALLLLPPGLGQEHVPEAVRPAGGAAIWRDPRLLVTLPALLAISFILTAFIFHQARLAAEKGWALEWLAGWFVVFAATQAVTSLVAGPMIDRLGAKFLLPLFLAPFGLGLALVASFSSRWIAPAYLMLMAVSAAVDATLAVKLWSELYGPASLARVRSTFEAVRVVVNGMAPAVTGLLLDHGISLSKQAVGCVVYLVAASALAATLPLLRKPA